LDRAAGRARGRGRLRCVASTVLGGQLPGRPRRVFRNRDAPGPLENRADILTQVKALGWESSYGGRMSERPIIDSDAAKVISLAAETRFAANGIVSRTLLRTPTSRLVLFGFAEGQELTEHTSTQHATIHILSGECEFLLSGKPHQLKAGDLLYMPPNLPHAVKATKQFSMLLTLAKPAEFQPTSELLKTSALARA
jgi:quercetin dioxygenase-like cupin family protein